MTELWIPIQDIPAEGRAFTFDDQELWRSRWSEFGMDVKPGADVVAEAYIMPQGENAALIRGVIKGSVVLPCDRCADDFEFQIDHKFDCFEEIDSKSNDLDGEEVRLVKEDGIVKLDMGALLWEEFALALPVKPVCDESCKGICPNCGKDLNSEECECEKGDGDPRLAVFRNLKVK